MSVLVDEASEAVDMDKDNTINLEEKLGNAAEGLQSCSLDMCGKLGREHHGLRQNPALSSCKSEHLSWYWLMPRL